MAPHTGRRCSAVCIVVALTALWTNSAFCPGHMEVPSSDRVPSPTRGFQLPRPRLGLKRPGSLESWRLVGQVSRAAEDKGFAGMKNILRVQAVGSGRGSFILEMGGIRILVNPNLQGSDLKPENVHEEFDYVFLSSEEPEFFHRPTVDKMKLTKVKFVTSQKAGQELAKMMVRNLAVLQNGPGGQCYLQKKDKAAAAVGVLSAPGSGSFPWEKQEQGFIFVNLETGAAVAYEAFGQFLSKGASSNKPDIPEEAYQVDFLITPNLAEAAGVAAGLTQKGAKLRGVLRLPGEGPIQEEESPMAALDKAFGGIDDDPDQFRNFLKDQGPPLSDTRLLMAEPNGAAVDLEL
ncbi:unnamed protein product [Symbiodinium necroappetens]|uniref:Uncharacterized protein n=1 Tax=Symbiodinium necroappetens TaxID=1628268 RepID=A0A812VJX8_9DINO|nr:unnamed protein product [Symbiodinium necroappetens]